MSFIMKPKKKAFRFLSKFSKKKEVVEDVDQDFSLEPLKQLFGGKPEEADLLLY
jgi:hypothetical protein